MNRGPIELTVVILIVSLLIGVIGKSIKFCLAWYFAFHFAKKFRLLPPHLQPPVGRDTKPLSLDKV